MSISGVPDQNFKPSTILWDNANSTTFAWQGNKNLGAGFLQILDNVGTPIVSFGGVPYTDAAAAANNPIGTGIIFNNAGVYNFVSVAQPLPVKLLPTGTSGGYTTYRNLDTQSTGVNIKNAIGQVYGWYIANLASSVRYVKLYNKATTPTVGVDTPIITIPIPANAASNIYYAAGLPFSNGVGIGGVTGVADNNSGAPTANDIISNIFYT